jgi:hypothetical protein
MNNFDAAIDAALDELRFVEFELESLERRRAKLRGDLLAMLRAADLGSIVRPGGRITQAAGRGKVEIHDHGLVPKHFLRVEVDASAILKEVRAGKVVPGVAVVEGEPTLRVLWANAPVGEAV